VATIVSIHSFRGGTGKSNTTANVAAILAQGGRRVGVIDADIQSPGIHVLFGLAGSDVQASLNDFLFGEREIADVALDVTDGAGSGGGRLFLIPSSMRPGEITRVLREGYDPHRLTTGLRELVDQLSLDVLLIDSHPGLHEETLLSLVLSNVLVIVMRPDEQDYEGTGITVRVAQELEVPRIMLVVNKTPDTLDPAHVEERVRAWTTT
jgi:septum site-determining protein MinD